MADSDYHRQYRLYLQALARWLARSGQRDVNRSRRLFYFYVRGLNGRDESTGVFFNTPTPADLDVNQMKNVSDIWHGREAT